MDTDTLEELMKPVFSQQHDRCDRCGAAASVRCVKQDQVLQFCGHHGNEHEPALVS